MCKSKCSGSCISLLNANLINSGESLTELNNLLGNLTVCGIQGQTGKSLFMTEVINLKAEARKLLDEVNYPGERSPSGKLITPYGCHNIFEDNSFKERLKSLKQRIRMLSAQMLTDS